jgi:hypothetical protein
MQSPAGSPSLSPSHPACKLADMEKEHERLLYDEETRTVSAMSVFSVASVHIVAVVAVFPLDLSLRVYTLLLSLLSLNSRVCISVPLNIAVSP